MFLRGAVDVLLEHVSKKALNLPVGSDVHEGKFVDIGHKKAANGLMEKAAGFTEGSALLMTATSVSIPQKCRTARET